MNLDSKGSDMDWGYVAGYFDGEGTAWSGPGNRSHHKASLSWCNTNQESLVAMQTFMGCGLIRSRPAGVHGRTKPIHGLHIDRRADILRVASILLGHCIIKQVALRKVIATVEKMKDENPNRGRIAAAGREEIKRLYWEEGLRLPDIAQRFGVSACAVKNYMRRQRIPCRNHKERNKGQGHSLEVRQRIRSAKLAQWRDPVARANMTNSMRGVQRKKRTASAA